MLVGVIVIVAFDVQELLLRWIETWARQSL
jgi:hypothetical protein